MYGNYFFFGILLRSAEGGTKVGFASQHTYPLAATH
jgi:hypothetical protein